MPNAMAPMLRLWRSTDPFLPDLFASQYGGGFQCGGTKNQPPNVAIILPSDNSHLNYGGVNGVHFSAQATDPEDDFKLLSITWIDDRGNQIGSGPTFDKIYPAPGVQKVRAIAHDTHGAVSVADEVTFTLDNTPPTLQIIKPFLNQTLTTETQLQFEAYTFDPNEPFHQVPCNRVVWTSGVPDDPQLTGCTPTVTFHSAGTRTYTVTATDTQGAAVTRTVVVTVTPKFPPPQVVISSPIDGQSYGFDETIPLTATVTDKSGTQPATQWTAFILPDVTPIPLGTGNTLSLTPSAILPQSCQTHDVYLRARVENQFGYDEDYVTVTIQGQHCGTPKVTILSPQLNGRDFFVYEQVPLSAEVLDPSAPLLSDTRAPGPVVNWSIQLPFDGGEIFLGTGNPFSWSPANTLPGGCRSNNYTVIARASNAAGETAAFRQVYIQDNASACD